MVHFLMDYPAIKKNEIMPFAATWMDLAGVILCEVTQTEEKYHMTLLNIWNFKNDKNGPPY